jgi:hypothetical protein
MADEVQEQHKRIERLVSCRPGGSCGGSGRVAARCMSLVPANATFQPFANPHRYQPSLTLANARVSDGPRASLH